MSYQDPPRHRRPSRYPTVAQYEDGYPSYQDSQGYQSYRDTSYQDTRVGYQRGNGYADGYGGYAGLTGGREREQRPPWDDQGEWEQPAARQAPQHPSGPLPQRTSGPLPQCTSGPLPRRTSGPFFAASDDDYGDYTAPRDDGYRRARHSAAVGLRGSRGLVAGGLTGFLAAAVAIGVANLVAAFVRPQASPIIAVGGAFIDRTPPALKNFAVEKFGENDKTMLLLGMYVTIALIAIAIGAVAWRRMAVGVAGIGLFGLFGAFVAITRPESHVTDVIPSIVGGVAGIVVLVWLIGIGMQRSRRDRTGRAGGNA